MTIDRLLQILDDWKLWMQQPNHKLGYPSKSAFLQSGGASTNDAFEILIEEADLKSIIAIDSIIDGLPKTQIMAINARYLGSIKPKDYEHQLDMAMDNILTLATKRDLV